MKIDFFQNTCSEAERKDDLFGICDEEGKSVAFTDTLYPKKWIAEVINKDKLAIKFTAIDHCLKIHKQGTKDDESTCDGMLTFDKHLYLVELKNQGVGGWVTDAIQQLSNSIRLLKEYNSTEIEAFQFKKAYACNRKHPRFQTIDSQRKKKFFDQTGFRLHVGAEIKT